MNPNRWLGIGIAVGIATLALRAEETNQPSRGLGGFVTDWLKHAATNLTESINTNSAAGAPPAGTISSGRSPNAALESFSNTQLEGAVRLAISNGLERAVMTLGRTNGFLTNLNVRIPLPSQLAKTEHTLRNLGQGELVDEFVATMNHAAEKAVPEAAPVFAGALSQMTVADARTLLTSGSKTAVSDYFRKTTTNQLAEKFLPMVRQATAQTGVTSVYKRLVGKIPFASVLLGDNAADLDDYVTAKALEGLFTMIGEEEKRIRENPEEQATTLLRNVFGALQKGGQR
jgi:hypothetical protein